MDFKKTEFLVVAVAEAGAIILAGMKIITAEQFLDFSKWIVSVYVVGRSAAKILKK